MNITLSNKTELTGLTCEQYGRITQALTFPNPKHEEALKFGRSVWNIPKTIDLFEQTPDGLTIPRGICRISLGWMDEGAITDNRHRHPVQITTNIELRDYQARALHLALDKLGGVFVAPTGSGKTTLGIELAARLGERCLILVKSLDLAKQWIEAIKDFTGLECGLIGGGKWQEGEAFTVALTQTLAKHKDSLDYGLIIADECHNLPAAQAYAVINQQAAKYRFGLSATPLRRDNLEFMIYAALGPIVATVEAHEVDGAVLPVTVATLAWKFRVECEPTSWQAFITALENDTTRNNMLVDSAIKSSRTTGTVILTSTITHAESLYSLIKQQGIDALLLHGQLSKKEREQRMNEAPKAGLIIGTLTLLGEGINWPHVGGVIFAAPVSASVDSPTPTATRLIQAIGRGRRPYPGKSKTFVLDIIDSHPFGLAAYKKRAEIYRQQGFLVHSSSH